MLTAKAIYSNNYNLFCTLCEMHDYGALWFCRDGINDLIALEHSIGEQAINTLAKQCATYAIKNNIFML